MRNIASIFAAGGFPLLIACAVLAFDDNSIRALSIEIAIAAVFLGGCVLLVGVNLANAVRDRNGIPGETRASR